MYYIKFYNLMINFFGINFYIQLYKKLCKTMYNLNLEENNNYDLSKYLSL